MATIYYVPRETTACALGADRVASVLEAHLPTGDVLVRNGSRGLCWLEPLLEVAAGEQRIAFGPVGRETTAAIIVVGSMSQV